MFQAEYCLSAMLISNAEQAAILSDALPVKALTHLAVQEITLIHLTKIANYCWKVVLISDPSS